METIVGIIGFIISIIIAEELSKAYDGWKSWAMFLVYVILIQIAFAIGIVFTLAVVGLIFG